MGWMQSSRHQSEGVGDHVPAGRATVEDDAATGSEMSRHNQDRTTDNRSDGPNSAGGYFSTALQGTFARMKTTEGILKLMNDDYENNSQVPLLEAPTSALLTTADIFDRDGWTRSAITTFLGRPDSTQTWKYRGHGSGLRFFYRMERVLAVEAQPEFAEWKRKKARRVANTELRAAAAALQAKQAQEDRLARLAASFPRWQDALATAADHLFELNRYAKHQECRSYLRDEIYALKNDLIRVLYEQGYATECYEHHSDLPAKACFRCDGMGTDDYDGHCFRCGGSSVFLPAKRLTFIVFKFRVAEKSYCWHQPQHLVRFAFTTTQAPSEFDLPREEKVVSLPNSEFGKAKELIRWVIGQATATPAMAA